MSRPELARTGPPSTLGLAGIAAALVLAGLGLLILGRGLTPAPVLARD